MIRDAKASDAAEICRIYNPFIIGSFATFEETQVSHEEVCSRILSIQDANFPYLVFTAAGGIQGYAYATRWKPRSAYRHTVEVSVYIDPLAQGKGIGGRLYEELFFRLREAEYHSVIGVITLPNEASIKLHEKFGLSKVAHFSEVGRKFGRWIDVGYWQGFLNEEQKPLQ